MSLWVPLPLENCCKLGLRLPIQGQHASRNCCKFLAVSLVKSPSLSVPTFQNVALSFMWGVPSLLCPPSAPSATSSENFVNFMDFNEHLGALFRNSFAHYKTAFLPFHSTFSSISFLFFVSCSVLVFLLLLRANSSSAMSQVGQFHPHWGFIICYPTQERLIAVYS